MKDPRTSQFEWLTNGLAGVIFILAAAFAVWMVTKIVCVLKGE